MRAKKIDKENKIFKVIATFIPFLILILFFSINNVFAKKGEYNIETNLSKGIIAEKGLTVEASNIVNYQIQLEEDYSLYTMNVADDKGNLIDYTYDNNILTFKMPESDVNIQIVAIKQLTDGVYMSVFTKEDTVYGYNTLEVGSIELINTLSEPIELVSTGLVNNDIYDYNSELLQNYVIMPASKTEIKFNLKTGLQAGQYSDLFQFAIKHNEKESGLDLTEQFTEKLDITINKIIVTELPKVTLSPIKKGQALKDVNLTYEEIPYGNLMWEDENTYPIEGTVISPMLINIEDTTNYDFSLLNQYFISDNQMRFYVNVEVIKEETTTQDTSYSEQEIGKAKNSNITKEMESVTNKETQSIEDTTKEVESVTETETQSIKDNTTKVTENVTTKETQSIKNSTTNNVENVTETEIQSVKDNTESVTVQDTDTIEDVETIIDKENDITKSEEASTEVLKEKDIMLNVPSKVSLIIDPYKISGNTSIYSDYIKFENKSEDEVDINMVNFKVNVKKQSVTNEPPCKLYIVDNNGNKYELNNGDNTNVFSMKLSGVNSNESISGFYIQGDITEGNIEGWLNSDIQIFISYNMY